MRKLSYKISFLLAVLAFSTSAQADIMEDFDSLGGNNVLLEKVKDLNPDTQVSVVQDRTVSRRHRFEVAPEFSSVVGGDAYNKTNSAGININYHFTPQWSLGVKYEKSYNKLTREGEFMISKALEDKEALIPDIDYPKQSYMALVNFYPVYGKMNLYDLGILQFDVYGILGYGNVSLRSGTKPTYTAGGGMGMWFSKHLTSRLEARYQTYEAERVSGTQKMDLTVLSFQIGYLL